MHHLSSCDGDGPQLPPKRYGGLESGIPAMPWNDEPAKDWLINRPEREVSEVSQPRMTGMRPVTAGKCSSTGILLSLATIRGLMQVRSLLGQGSCVHPPVVRSTLPILRGACRVRAGLSRCSRRGPRPWRERQAATCIPRAGRTRGGKADWIAVAQFGIEAALPVRSAKVFCARRAWAFRAGTVDKTS